MSETAIAALPKSANRATWTGDQTALMESLGLKGVKRQKRGDRWVEIPFEAPYDIVQAFLYQIERTKLDPVARQIYCIERGGKWGIQASIDGFRLIAERTGRYAGQTPVQWTGDGERWVDVWLRPEPPAAARVGIYRTGFPEPIWAVATYSGYVQRNYEGNPTGQWLTNPSNQLGKCAEMLGLRKAFPQDLSGLYGTEEMDQAGNPSRGAVPAVATPPAAALPAEPRKPSFDWAGRARRATTLEQLRELDEEVAARGERGLKLIDEEGQPSVGGFIRWCAARLQAAVETAPEPQPELPIVEAEIVEAEPSGSWEAVEPGTGVPDGEPPMVLEGAVEPRPDGVGANPEDEAF